LWHGGFDWTAPAAKIEDNWHMESARRILQVIRAAMLVSIGFYVAISVAIPSTATPNLIILRAVSVLAVMLILTIIVVRRLFVLRSEAALAAQPSDSKVLARWRVGYLLTYVLSTFSDLPWPR